MTFTTAKSRKWRGDHSCHMCKDKIRKYTFYPGVEEFIYALEEILTHII
jgi:hypothetical protein